VFDYYSARAYYILINSYYGIINSAIVRIYLYYKLRGVSPSVYLLLYSKPRESDISSTTYIIMMTLPYRYPLFRSSGRTHTRKHNHFGYQSDRGNRIISSSRTLNPHTPTRYFHHFIAGLDGIGAISCALHRRS